MINSRLIYFCIHNVPSDWVAARNIWWWEQSRAFCPFLKEWEKCFCVVETESKSFVKWKFKFPDPEWRANWNQMVEEIKEQDDSDDEYKKVEIEKWRTLESDLNYKFSVNLWTFVEFVEDYSGNLYAVFEDKDWIINSLFLWNRDKELSSLAWEFLALLLSCDELWYISLRFWEKVSAYWPWSWWSIVRWEKKEYKCWPCDKLYMLNNWEDVTKTDREDIKKHMPNEYWESIEKYLSQHIDNKKDIIKEIEWNLGALVEIAKKKGLKFEYPQAWLILD